MPLEHHLVGGYVRYISPHIIIIITVSASVEYCAISLIGYPAQGTDAAREAAILFTYL